MTHSHPVLHPIKAFFRLPAVPQSAFLFYKRLLTKSDVEEVETGQLWPEIPAHLKQLVQSLARRPLSNIKANVENKLVKIFLTNPLFKMRTIHDELVAAIDGAKHYIHLVRHSQTTT